MRTGAALIIFLLMAISHHSAFADTKDAGKAEAPDLTPELPRCWKGVQNDRPHFNTTTLIAKQALTQQKLDGNMDEASMKWGTLGDPRDLYDTYLVDLGNRKAKGILAVAKHGAGGHCGPEWVFANSKLLLSLCAGGRSPAFLDTTSHGFKDICNFQHVDAKSTLVEIYRYDGDSYKRSKCTVETDNNATHTSVVKPAETKKYCSRNQK